MDTRASGKRGEYPSSFIVKFIEWEKEEICYR